MKPRKSLSLVDFIAAAMLLNQADLLMGSRLAADHKVQETRTEKSTNSTSATSPSPLPKIFYAKGNSDEDLPVCTPYSVCNKVDTYSYPWIRKQCRCPDGSDPCSTSVTPADGKTITDRTRQLKICEPISKLPKCRFFHDITWTYLVTSKNGSMDDSSMISEQKMVVNCICPKHSVAYILKRFAYILPPNRGGGVAYQYAFACSPKSDLKCEKKEPCRLFSVKKTEGVEDVVSNTLCRCQRGMTCPKRHTDPGTVSEKNYLSPPSSALPFVKKEAVRTYSAYCVP